MSKILLENDIDAILLEDGSYLLLDEVSTPPVSSLSTLTFLEGRSSSANASSYSFLGVVLGSENTSRSIIVTIAWRSGGTSNYITGVTVGGVSATQLEDLKNTSGSNISGVSVWSVNIPAGTSADIVVNTLAEAVRLGIAVYSITGNPSFAGSITSAPSSTGNVLISESPNFSNNSHVVGIVFNGAGRSFISSAYGDVISGTQTISVQNTTTNSAWVGLTESYDSELEATNASYSAFILVYWNTVTAPTQTTVYKGLRNRLQKYLGIRNNAALYLGTKNFNLS